MLGVVGRGERRREGDRRRDVERRRDDDRRRECERRRDDEATGEAFLGGVRRRGGGEEFREALGLSDLTSRF